MLRRQHGQQPASGRQSLRSEAARTFQEFPGRRTMTAEVHPALLHEFFEAQADARPEAVAVVFDGRETTYAELDQQANRLARHLRASGLGRGSLAAMLLPRSADAYAALLGILKSGAAYVPLDPE